MATGLEIYDALREATRQSPEVSEFRLNPVDACGLRKLTTSDLVSRNSSEEVSEEVSSALLNGDYGPLERLIGLRLTVTNTSPRL